MIEVLVEKVHSPRRLALALKALEPYDVTVPRSLTKLRKKVVASFHHATPEERVEAVFVLAGIFDKVKDFGSLAKSLLNKAKDKVSAAAIATGLATVYAYLKALVKKFGDSPAKLKEIAEKIIKAVPNAAKKATSLLKRQKTTAAKSEDVKIEDTNKIKAGIKKLLAKIKAFVKNPVLKKVVLYLLAGVLFLASTFFFAGASLKVAGIGFFHFIGLTVPTSLSTKILLSAVGNILASVGLVKLGKLIARKAKRKGYGSSD